MDIGNGNTAPHTPAALEQTPSSAVRAPAGAPRAPAARCERTAASRRRCVEGAIGAMRERLGEPLSLPAIARTAASSPYHFDRVFRQMTGMPPFRFLAALRLDAARRLLLTTRYSAATVCYEVGYSSVGSFTRQFAEAVGMPPARLRGFAAEGAGPAALSRVPDVADAPAASRGGLAGVVRVPDGFAGAVFVGVFTTPLPRGRPVDCALLRAGGPFRIGPLADGEYYVFAAGIATAPGAPSTGALLQEDALRSAHGPIQIRSGQAPGPMELVLRPRDALDPPILVSLPVLLAERLSRRSGSRAGPHRPQP